MGGSGRHRWFSFHHNSASDQPNNRRHAPPEFLCPISGLIMSDPVVVPSGQTFERISVQVCRNLGFVPVLEDNTRPDFSTVIPNLTMKSTILSWCKRVGTENPRPPEYAYVEGVVRARMGSGPGIQDPVRSPSVMDDIQPVQSRFGNLNLSSSSVESVTIDPNPVAAPNNLAGRDSSSSFSWSGSSSTSSGTTSGTDNPIQNPSSFSATNISSFKPVSPEEEEVCEKLRSPDRLDNEQGLILLRKMTRLDEEARVSLCTDGILSFLRSMIISRYGQVQTNAAASLVNLSLEKRNKVKIVRSGFVPLLIDVLKSGTAEAQEHAAGSIFSLAVEEENKMVIGVLGALPPLLHALRAAESDRARHDAANALYHLTSIPSNQTKLIRSGAVPTLLSMIRSTGDAPSSSASSNGVLLILCNLATCPEGKAAMLEGNAVTILVGKLRDSGASEDLDMERENCVAALLNLSIGNLRFKGMAREAGAEEVLKEVVKTGNENLKEKAAKILRIMSAEAADGAGAQAREWEQMLVASGLSRVAYSSNF